ncbi:hypothetical protein BDW59DRAFT_182043 [Aspergillus cavernicola]|uniref:Uncharacterized protein n=1 Tax=Aspergillus cavernicola TaxID=176166 RepID=A0ABR4HQH9_9EURO
MAILSSTILSGLSILAVGLLMQSWLRHQPQPNTITSISPAQKTQLHEIAALMLEIYQTLAEMRYLNPESIHQGPHNLSSLHPLYTAQNIDPEIVYLYSILPYYIGSPPLDGETDFFHGGTFADFREEEDIEQSRDPFYAGPDGVDFDAGNGPYMQSWMTPLSRLGNHGSVILYDARVHQIWIIDQEGWVSTDPGLDEEEEDDDGGVKEEAGVQRMNRNSFEHIPSRPAGDVLRDINRWFRELEVLPGVGEYSGPEWDDEELDLRGLYREYGWLGEFDGEGFEVGKTRAYCSGQARYKAEEPLRAVEALRGWRMSFDRDIERCRGDIAKGGSVDEEWVARFELWKMERVYKCISVQSEEKEAIAAGLCPGGICIKEDELVVWEAEVLRQEARSKRDSISRYREWAEDSEQGGRGWEIATRAAEKEADIYRKAYEAASADAERMCPGKNFESVSGRQALDEEEMETSIRKLKDKILNLDREVQEATEWAGQLPDEAVQARAMVEQEIHGFRSRLEFERGVLTRMSGHVVQ